ncbi:MAG: GNAT family N-acetyltransferase [Chloroflexota bacterium]|nr:GNAT family N-acetyltransferase [Chloroflexota bacterium]
MTFFNGGRIPSSLLVEVHQGIEYRCFCPRWDVQDITVGELWEMFEVRWAALSEERLDKDLATFLIRDSIDLEENTVQVAAFYQGRVLGGLRVHLAEASLLKGIPGVQVSRVGVSKDWRGRGIGHTMVSKAVRIAKDVAVDLGLNLIFLLGRVIGGRDPKRVLRLYERAGFTRTSRFIETKGLLNCLMVATVHGMPDEHLSALGFRVTEVRDFNSASPTPLLVIYDKPADQSDPVL